jgi:hypothetical protein
MTLKSLKNEISIVVLNTINNKDELLSERT